jgi:release factor glutamine methyltransferase
LISPELIESLFQQLSDHWAPLPDKPAESPDSTIQALLLKSGGDPSAFRDLVLQRIDGAPLSHLTGRQVFMGIELIAGPEALIPRQETEIVCKGALSKLPASKACRILDVCCGAGNLGLALAVNLPLSMIEGSDLSPDAVSLANRNSAFLGLTHRASFQTGDLFSPFDLPQYRGLIDLIICNPPYISSARVAQLPREIAAYEPRLAFDGGPFGVRILTRLVREAPRFLKPEGWLAFEVGLGQGPAMRKILEASLHYQDVVSLNDARGETRAFLVRAAAANV